MGAILPLILFGWLSLWGAELKIPPLTSPVIDEAGFLSEVERKSLSDLAYEIYTNKGPQITILTVPDLQEYPIEEFSIRVAEKWKLGMKKKGNGLLITVSKAERKVRIEVGEGIEGEITDLESSRWIRNILTPAFKQGQFYLGFRTVMVEVAREFGVNPTAEGAPIVSRAPVRHSNGMLNNILPFLLIVLVIGHILMRKPLARGLFSGAGMAGVGYFLIPGVGIGLGLLFFLGFILGLIGISNLLFALLMSGGRRGGGFGGGGFGGGGGWGGGGGGFSGGGSSGSW